MPRKYILQPNPHYGMHVGLDNNGNQVIVNNYGNDTIIAVFFDQSGIYLRTEKKDYCNDNDIQKWISEIGLQQQTISIEKFFHREYQIGIEDYPDEIDMKTKRDAFSSTEISEIIEESKHWMTSEKFVFWWYRDFWMNVQGKITDT